MKFGENSAHVISVDTNRIVVSYRISGFSVMMPINDNNNTNNFIYHAIHDASSKTLVSEWLLRSLLATRAGDRIPAFARLLLPKMITFCLSRHSIMATTLL